MEPNRSLVKTLVYKTKVKIIFFKTSAAVTRGNGNNTAERNRVMTHRWTGKYLMCIVNGYKRLTCMYLQSV